jgi:hypothetical protein
MEFMELRKNDTVVWAGKTVDGPDYWNQEGNFEFRLVVVDDGGNVSPTVYYKRAEMNWPQLSTPDRWSDHN